MTELTGYTDGDVDTNRSDNPSLGELIAKRYSRRDTLRSGASAAAVAVLGGSMLAACDSKVESDPMPTVTFGSSGVARSGNVVTLTGTATDNGQILAQSLTQVSGPTVTLSSTTTNSATFLAPSVSAATDLVFRYTAADEHAGTGTTTTTVTVQPAALGFTAVAHSLADVVTVPAGYTATVLYRLGDPLDAATPAFKNDGTDTTFSKRAGDHHDGMSFFGLAATGSTPDKSSSTRGVLVMNHENVTRNYLHVAGPTSSGGLRPESEVLKEIEVHGVSVVEIKRDGDKGAWSYVPAGALNRRVTPLTPTAFSGPVKGNAQLKTAYSPTGVAGRGTVNNCANGYMPWNTYLTCEENWAGYFRRDAGDDANRTALYGAPAVTALNRYGLSGTRAGNYDWTRVTPADPTNTNYSKFNITVDTTKPADGTGDFRFEANQYGWVVEIDPFDASKPPRKRTALGRMNHEGVGAGRVVAGVKPAFYMGDDATNEYIYKFVSATKWADADATATDRLAIGDKYLDSGTLYVAKFNADGSGAWLPLVFGTGALTSSSPVYPFADQADVLTFARLAGDALGATKMDRPEWTAVNPVTGEMYATLTNNSTRTVANTDAANPRAYVDPKTPSGSTSGNANGHIIRLREDGDTTEATTFKWDVYAFGSGADLDATNINLSGLDATNDFSSPDGLWFGRGSNASGLVTPVLWIETDDGAFTDQTNCMLLAAMPGKVGDGGTKSITNTIGATAGTQTARLGKAPGTQLRRFLVGPKECEITGIDSTPDGRSVFINIQHPGENGSAATPSSNWPQGSGARPRSATVVITKDDGGVVAL